MVYKAASYLQKQLKKEKQQGKKYFKPFKNNCMKGKYITTQILIACGGKKRNRTSTMAA
jgi:hypothetical protein